MFKKVLFLFLFLLGSLCAANYDGVWFLGFNLDKEIFQGENGRNNRIYLSQVIDRQVICKKIFPDEKLAESTIYPLEEYAPINALADVLTKPITPEAKLIGSQLILMHTDGIKTCQAAQLIAAELASKNINVILRKIDTSKYDNWEKALLKKDYDLFLMGFKSEYKKDIDTYLLPLFSSSGYANFMGYHNPVVDRQLTELAKTSANGKTTVYKLLDKSIAADLPILPIFYIEEMH